MDPLIAQIFATAAERGITQAALARKADRSPEWLSRLKRGNCDYRGETLHALAAVVGLEVVVRRKGETLEPAGPDTQTREDDVAPPEHALDGDVLAASIEIVERELQAVDRRLPADRKGVLVSAVYGTIVDHGDGEVEPVRPLIRSLVAVAG